jgi:hypothetical protein
MSYLFCQDMYHHISPWCESWCFGTYRIKPSSMVVYTPIPSLSATLTPYEYLDRHLDTISHQMDEMMLHFCTLATPDTPNIRPVSDDSTIATEPSTHDDVPAGTFSATMMIPPVLSNWWWIVVSLHAMNFHGFLVPH